MAPTPRIRPYKDFLTPALHRRFATATVILLGLCYAESVVIGEWNSFIWSWLPFGRAGIRTGLLFIPAFMIFVLRVAQLHVGIRTSYSAWYTFRSYALKWEVVQTVGWYFLSAYLFSEIYIWSASKDADLNRIKLIPKTDRTALNERPIYLTSFLFFVALAQAGFHLFYDYDRLDMPVTKTGLQVSKDQKSPLVVLPTQKLKEKFPHLVITSLKRATAIATLSPLIYSIDFGIYPYSVRRFAWSFTRGWAKVFWTLPKSNSLPSIRPFHWSVLSHTVFAGFLLTLLWELANAAFTTYVAQEPLKNERPITYESRDPNGSLLTGLRGKKLQTRAFAFWELVYIAERFEGRRKAIFEDIDRKGGSTWSQILGICLEVITNIDSRIAEYQAPRVVPAKAVASQNSDAKSSLPRLGQPLKDGLNRPGDIFSQPPKSGSMGVHIEAVGKFAKDHGQSPPSSLSPRTRKILDKAEGVILTKEQKEALATQGLVGLFRDWIGWFLQTSAGKPFRQEYRRKLAAVVLGQPYGDVGVIVDAIDALTRFAVCSLKEDKYGNVQRDVKLIIRTFTNTVMKLDSFKKSVGVHWTDVEKKQESPETDTILAALKSGLNELVEAFGDYSDDLRLSQSEMRLAREAATPAPARPEMEQKK
ncbi:Nucleoporin protein Ndc1-Nup [Hyaloscypha variabilis]